MLSAAKVISQITSEISAAVNLAPVGDAYLKLVETFPLMKIESKEQNKAALRVMEHLITYMNSHDGVIDSGTKKQIHQYMKCLGNLIHDFEKEAYSIGKMSGAEMLAYFMHEHGLNQKDLSKELGGQSVVSKILKGERQLNKNQIEKLARRFNVSVEVFFG
ncbi:MAG: helix-turn-helix domain-containing protein [Bdellovibrionota bacterium]